LVFLVILIVATSVLIGWLLVELARFVARDLARFTARNLGFERAPERTFGLTVSEPQAPSSSAPPPKPVSPDGDRGATGPTAERVLYDEADVERAIRDRLYGGRGRRRS
jgi:hypothetical protein